jgi:type I restriction enzyme S subunit
MGSEWITCSLGDLLKVKHGFAFKGEYFTEETTDSLLVTPGNFAIGGGFQNLKPKYYNGPISEDNILSKRQVVVMMTYLSKQSDTLGLAAMVPNDEFTWLHNQRIGLLEFKDEIPADPLFISYLLRTHIYRLWVIGSASGTNVKHTSPGRIESFECSIPPFKEQKSIAHILGTLDDKIELNRQMNATLEAMAQALFKSWFVDFDPVIDNALAAGNPIPEQFHARAEARKRLGDQRKPLPEAIRQQFPSRFVLTEEMGWVPEGWDLTNFGNVANQIKDNVISENVGNYDFYVGLEHIGRKQLFLLDHGMGDSVDSNKSKFEEWDLLFGKLRPYFHKVCIAPQCGICSTDILVFRAKQTIFHSFMVLTVFTEAFVEYANLRSTGTRMPRASAKDMMEYPIVLPSINILEKFDNTIKPLWNRGISSIANSKELSNLRDTLLPKLLSGQLRIPDAEVLLDSIE